MKGSVGLFLLGIFVGAAGVIGFQQLQKQESALNPDALKERIHDSLNELEDRIREVTATATP